MMGALLFSMRELEWERVQGSQRREMATYF